MQDAGRLPEDHTQEVVRLAVRQRFQEAERLLSALPGGKTTKAMFHKLIHSCANNTDAAAWFLRKMWQAGYMANCVSYNCMLTCCIKADDMPQAQRWWDDMIAQGIKPSRVSYNTMISAFSRRLNVQTAEQWMLRMIQDGHAPCNISYYFLFDGFAKVIDVPRTTKWFEYMIDTNFVPELEVYRSSIYTFCAAGSFRDVEKVYQHMQQHGIRMDNQMASQIFAACCHLSDEQQLAFWCNTLLPRGYVVDSNTFSLIVTTFYRGSRPCTVRPSVFLPGGIAPSIGAYLQLLQCLAETGDMDGCLQCLRQMASRGFPAGQGEHNYVFQWLLQSTGTTAASQWLDEMARRGLSVDHTTAQIVSGSLAPRGLLLPLSEKVIRMAIASSSTYLVLTLVSLLEHWRVPMSDECATDVICHGLDVLQSGQPNDEQVDIAGRLLRSLVPNATFTAFSYSFCKVSF